MKKFLEDVFKPYLFPLLLGFLTVYYREALDFEPITSFFSNSSSKIVNLLSSELYVWQIIFYGIIISIIVKLFSRVINLKSKEERKMLRAIAKDSREFYVEFQDNQKFLARYKLGVIGEEYAFEKFAMYCNNCDQEPKKMTSYNYDSRFACIKCSCSIDYPAIKNIKTGIVNNVEKLER